MKIEDGDAYMERVLNIGVLFSNDVICSIHAQVKSWCVTGTNDNWKCHYGERSIAESWVLWEI